MVIKRLLLLLALGLPAGTAFLASAKQKSAPPTPDQQDEVAAKPPGEGHDPSAYLHHWVPLPALKGVSLTGQEVTLNPLPGYVEVVVFASTSCIPCQHLMPSLQALDKKHSSRNVRFTYVFSHDTTSDAKEFARVYGIKTGLVASHDLLKAYHDPLLPSVYVGDRHGWLLARFSKTTRKQVEELGTLLKHLTVF